MRGNHMDWEGFMKTHNRMKNTNYTEPEEWIGDLYEKHGRYVSPVSEELGIGWGTVASYLKKLNLYEKKPKGGARIRLGVGKKQAKFLNIPPKTMSELTIRQIMVRCDLCKGWCTLLLQRHKRKYRRALKL